MKLNKGDVALIHQSIQKWNCKAMDASHIPEDYSDDVGECPLCDVYFYQSIVCNGCPISKTTKIYGCIATPYIQWASEKSPFYLHRWSTSPKSLDAIEAEIEFLISLLPKRSQLRYNI